MTGDVADPREQLAVWHSRLLFLTSVHARSASRDSARGSVLGVTAVALSAIVGTAIFATLSKNPSLALRVVTGALAVVAAACTALQSFLNYPTTAAAHRAAAARYGALARRVEVSVAQALDGAQLADAMSAVAKEWNEVDAERPFVSIRMEREVEEEEAYEKIKRLRRQHEFFLAQEDFDDEMREHTAGQPVSRRPWRRTRRVPPTG